MADKHQIEPEALAFVLDRIKLDLDQAAAYLRDPSIRPLRAGGALDDNNSSCNTACSCGHAADSGIAERGGG